MAPKINIFTVAKESPYRHLTSRFVYVCLQCRQDVSNASIKAKSSLRSFSTPFRYASTSTFSGRVRNRIWGTDTPPGLEDPYGPPSLVEQKRQKKELRDRRENFVESKNLSQPQSAFDEEDHPEDPLGDSDATTWEGMPVVGGHGWGMKEWNVDYPFEGFDYTMI